LALITFIALPLTLFHYLPNIMAVRFEKFVDFSILKTVRSARPDRETYTYKKSCERYAHSLKILSSIILTY